MPADLSIGPSPAAAPSHFVGRGGTVASAAPAADRTPDATPVQHADSELTLDPRSDRVVVEYFDAAGTLTHATPSRQQLDAYRVAALAGEAATHKP